MPGNIYLGHVILLFHWLCLKNYKGGSVAITALDARPGARKSWDFRYLRIWKLGDFRNFGISSQRTPVISGLEAQPHDFMAVNLERETREKLVRHIYVEGLIVSIQYQPCR